MFRNFIFLFSFYAAMIRITPFYFQIKKYEKANNKELLLKEMQKVNNFWGSHILKSAHVTVDVTGLEKLPKEACLYVCNHQGNFDIPVITATLDRQFGFITKSPLKKVPILSHWITAVGGLYINRDNPRESLKTIQEGIEKIQNGFSIFIFPEGTRSKKQSMNEFKKGSMRLAVKTKAPIVPITIQDSYKRFEEQNKVTPGVIKLTIHDPIDTASLSREELKHINETVEEIIKSGIEND